MGNSRKKSSPQKQVRMNTLYGSKNRISSQQRLLPNNQQPTKDSLLKVKYNTPAKDDISLYNLTASNI
jgi:hypothetical protein